MGSARLRPLTIVLATILGVWFGLDFVGWSHLVEHEPLVSLAGFMLVLMLLFIVGGMFQLRYVATGYVLAVAVWAYLQWTTHWSTYFFASSAAKLNWYGRVFGRHWHLLPNHVDHTTPDAYHTILAALIVANLASAARDVFARQPQSVPASHSSPDKIVSLIM